MIFFLVSSFFVLYLCSVWLPWSLYKTSHRDNSAFPTDNILPSLICRSSVLFLFPFYVFVVSNYPLKKIIYFTWRLITLQYCGGFCPTFTWISHACTCVPHPEPPAHFPPHAIPQGHPNAPALSTQSHALNLDWRSISHMVIYMFQCYCLKSSHPHLLPQSPKVYSLHLCLLLSHI